MTVRLDDLTRPEPDIAYLSTSDFGRTWFDASEVRLAVEIVSVESERRDRKLKPVRYAEAGIPHFWRVEEEDGFRSSTSSNSNRPPVAMSRPGSTGPG